VQNAGDDLRVTVRLIDATVGHSIWSDRYDRELGEVFALQDDIVREVLVALQVELLDGEHAKVASRGTTNLDAWLLRLQAMNELYKFTRASTVRTRELLEAAHQVDPNWSRPLGGIAWSYWWEAKQGWTDDRERWIERGVDFAERAIALAPDDTLGYMQLGNLMQLKGDHARAVALREKAVEIAPNDFQATWGLGTVLFRAGEPERAIQVLEHAQGLSPRQPPSFLWGLAQAQLVAGQYEDAIRTAEEASARGPDDPMPIIQRVAGLSGLGRMDDAHAAVAELLRIDPDFSASAWKTGMAEYADQMAVERLAQLLIDAGLPL
jgi:tetratricopeptide (TPR) repeat protein